MICGVMGGTPNCPKVLGKRCVVQRFGAALAAGLSERLSERLSDRAVVLAGALLR
jgi:hypothetical protein